MIAGDPHLVPKILPPGLLPSQEMKLNTSHRGYTPCCTVLLLPLHQLGRRKGEKSYAGGRHISFCVSIHFSPVELQMASEGESLQNPVDEDLGSPCFPDISQSSVYGMEQFFVPLRINITRLIFYPQTLQC